MIKDIDVNHNYGDINKEGNKTQSVTIASHQ